MHIMISYVRREATQHARDLKNELQLLGCNTFLDVDEIKAGNDWHDVLNNAVINCGVFVALITPSYGETKWTKRELQFADTLDKLIIPINFLKTWPPLSLAINLFSTQFIPWKTEDDIKEEIKSCDINRANDILFWDKVYVKRAAIKICEGFQSLKQFSIYMGSMFENNPRNEISPQSKFSEAYNYEDDVSMSYARKKGGLFNLISSHALRSSGIIKEKISVVISCNDKQHIFSLKIRDYLVKLGFSVWIANQSNQFGVKKFFLKLLGYTENLEEKQNNENNNWQEFIDYRNKVKNATVIILILSEDYYKSNTCKQQASYCNNSEQVIAIQYDNCKIPLNFSKLFDEQNLLIKQNPISNRHCNSVLQLNFLKTPLKNRIELLAKSKYYFKPSIYLEEGLAKEFRLNFPVNYENYAFVYISNRDNCETMSDRAQDIYECIGKELAKMSNIILVSGNSSNNHLVVNSFIKQNESDSNFYHVLPEYFHGMSADKNQITLNVGKSVKERDSMVSQMFKFCLLIDNRDEDICIAEEFLWNDNYVIPAVFGDISGENNDELPDTIKKMPNGVESEHWNALFDKHETPEKISISVKNIISCLTTYY